MDPSTPMARMNVPNWKTGYGGEWFGLLVSLFVLLDLGSGMGK